ncbi:MAG: dipeptidase [Acidobacteriota bacterium]|nr:dipeptidase [Acidobacteriota bacterium]
MRTLICSVALLLASSPLILAQTSPSSHTTPNGKLTPEQVEQSAIIIDTHADTPQRIADEGYDLADPLNGGNWNIESARKGNLGAEFFSIWVDPKPNEGHFAHRTLVLIDAVRQQVAKHPDQMMMAYSPTDIERAHRTHKIAALMGIEGGHSIEDSLGLLRDYYDLGVRYMTLTWSNSNGWADSSGDYDDPSVPHTKEGLTEFGKDVVYEMNRLGMMVDISHVSDKTFYRTLVITRAPVIASHSSSRALCDAPRNMTDDMLRALANNGGVVQVNFYSAFISQKYCDAQKAQRSEVQKAVEELKARNRAEGKVTTDDEVSKLERKYADRIPRPPLSDLIDQIDHIAKVAGVNHVGLGSDFDGVEGQLPEGINSPADIPKITAALMARGYTQEDMRKILGGNLLRVFRQVEAVSRQLKTESRPRITEKQSFSKSQK